MLNLSNPKLKSPEPKEPKALNPIACLQVIKDPVHSRVLEVDGARVESQKLKRPLNPGLHVIEDPVYSRVFGVDGASGVGAGGFPSARGSVDDDRSELSGVTGEGGGGSWSLCRNGLRCGDFPSPSLYVKWWLLCAGHGTLDPLLECAALE